MNLLMFFLYSIPEEFLIVALCITLAGYNISACKLRYIIVSLLLAISVKALQLLDLSLPLRSFFQFVILIILVKQGMGIPLLPLITCSVITLLVLQMNELLVMSIFTNFYDKTLQEIQMEPLLWFARTLPNLLLMSLFLYIIKKYKIFLFKENIPSNKLTFRSYWIFSAFYTFGIIGAITLEQGDIGPGYILVCIVIFQAFSLLVIQELVKSNRHETQLAVYKESIKNMTSLFTTIRSQRHDFANHIQVLYILAKQKEYEKLLRYIEQLVGQITSINEVLLSDNPELSALLQTKIAQFAQEKIRLRLHLTSSLTELEIPVIELNQIIGNLLDNAADAIKAADYPSDEILLETIKINNKVQIKVKNYRPIIPIYLQKKIFEYGFSTKQNHSGLGLAIVTSLVEKNKGTLCLISNEKVGTEFTITFPVKELKKIEQKTG
ncbi:ATP-binding protein [Aneurinibacillus thermoaerophilus]|uniref:sensor histidine kinase n=2 Tax=Aneurinibacillus thermoaerophilus TaxID=143495 RepID=UPI002E23EF80|nr:ATP-binding protein [Aneurinibacillus thermoaerophilus]MED0764372.1 ATP-binding protein [Aneurinibacillus thermoaerophilus]